MPIAIDPNQAVEASLASDAKTDASTRPTFIGRFLTARESLAADKKWNAAIADTSDNRDEVVILAAIADIESRLTGWRNITVNGSPVPYQGLALLDILTVAEIGELRIALRNGTSIGDDDAKK